MEKKGALVKYRVAVSDDKTFVWQLPGEDITMELAFRMSHDAICLARPLQIFRFLSDVRGIRNISNVVQNYEFAYEGVTAVGYSRADRIAVLHDEGDHTHDFIETASLNAGYRVRLFTDLNAALAWLTGAH